MAASNSLAAREPLVRIAKRADIAKGKAWAIRAAAIVLALLAGGLFILLLGHNPFIVYGDMFSGAVGKPTALKETVKIAIPLLGAALAIAPAFKMRFWNIGAEGQILAGAIGATYVALFWADKLPRVPLLCVMGIAGAVVGGLWGLVPGIFKAKWGTNETLFTLMLNYVALGFEKYLQHGPWKAPGSFPEIASFEKVARLPKLFGVHIGWVIVLIFVAAMFIYLRYSKQGYEISVVGESEATARYAGMNVPKIIMRTMFISGAICGVMGFLIVSGADYTLAEGTAGGIGFTAITVAWLAKLNPFVMVFIAGGLAILQKGANVIETNFQIPSSAAQVITGMILFCMLGCEFFINYRLIFRGRKEQNHG